MEVTYTTSLQVHDELWGGAETGVSGGLPEKPIQHIASWSIILFSLKVICCHLTSHYFDLVMSYIFMN